MPSNFPHTCTCFTCPGHVLPFSEGNTILGGHMVITDWIGIEKKCKLSLNDNHCLESNHWVNCNTWYCR